MYGNLTSFADELTLSLKKYLSFYWSINEYKKAIDMQNNLTHFVTIYHHCYAVR